MSLDQSEQNKPEESTTDFGYKRVNKSQKAHLVADVFHSVAGKYDLMNDLMSFGIHRLWKRLTIELSGVRKGHKVLDLAGGTGDLALKFSHLVGPEGKVTLADINSSMLEAGRDRLINKGLCNNIEFVLADAQELPFAENSFDLVTMAFGLRNVTDKDKALASIFRCLKPGGKLLVLEFSKPTNPLVSKFYDQYSFKILPFMGKLVAQDADSYRYLAESIRMHPDQKTLQNMMIEAGYVRTNYHNMTSGIVALHKGIKP